MVKSADIRPATAEAKPGRAKKLRVRLPLTDDRLWNIAEVAYYAGGCDESTVRRWPIPWTTGNPEQLGRGERLYDPREVKAYFTARRRQGAA